MSDYSQNDNGIKPISETSSRTSLTTPQSERRSGGIVERVSARIGRDIPPLNMEHINPTIVCFPVSVTTPGFSSLSPSLQSPNMFTDSSSQIIRPSPIPNDAIQEMVESSGGAHATMMISNKNLPHQPMEIDLSPQGCKKGIADIPTEDSVDITSHESNADPVGAPLLPSFDSEVVAEKDAMNLISLKSGSEDDGKDK
ncbi:probable WRKY transcription factor 10 [Brassica napus]|uniref:(rape) hypothetical protein n=1 Tax=Brassica napus TaxID=3708 RepID=A0A816ZLI2_BRANA|nr:probable WRKY transcription factor 10 [Brassica napus]CAF2213892.1 unnamed protein product [Brassica napus]